MSKIRPILFCLLLALSLCANAAGTDALVWHKPDGTMDADVRGETLPALLQKIASETGWRVYVEPGAARTVSTKFKGLPTGGALRMLLGDLNFELVPQTNSVARLYIFSTRLQNATRLVRGAKAATRHVANELLLKIKPGTDIDALAKMLGAKIIGRLDKDGIYRLQFADAAAADAALDALQSNTDVAEVDYNYYLDPPPQAQAISSAPVSPLSLQLNPPGDSGKVIVGLPDMAVQSLGAQLDKFILPQISVAGGAAADNADITHGTAMAYTILQAIAQASGGSSSVQILPVDIYGGSETTTSWNVALGIQQAVDHGANVLNLSLGGAGDSSILDGVIQQAVADGIPVFAAAGNQPVSTATYPAADPGVIAVTALQKGQIASYANYGSFVDLAVPGTSVVYFGNQAYLVQGTSVSTANATGLAAGTKGASGNSWSQIEAALQQKFAVPAK
jgi:hypothetical protein